MGLRDALARLKHLPSRQRRDDEMGEELRLHVELLTGENIRGGMSPAEARRAARRQFGGVEQIKEDCRQVRGVMWLESTFRDITYAARTLTHSPIFSIIAVFTLALGIGATTAIFSVINGVLLAPLPYREADRLVMLRSANDRRQTEGDYVSVVDFADWQAQCRSFDGMALYQWKRVDLRSEGNSERIEGMQVTPEFFRIVSADPTLGRGISEEEYRSDLNVVVLSGRLWRERFGADRDLVGRTIDINSWRSYPNTGATPYTVVGVLEEESRFLPVTASVHERHLSVDDRVDFWMPLRLSDEERERRDWRGYYRAVARLADGVTLSQAQQELTALSVRLAEEFPDTNAGWTVELVPLQELIIGEVRPTLWLLLAAVGFLLLIALANVASLLLVRGVSRQRELSVRAALGADRIRLVRQLLAESLLLGLVAGAVGVGLAFAGVAVLKGLAPSGLPRVEDVCVDARALGVALVVSMLTGSLVGMLPAWIVTRSAPLTILKSGSRTASASRSQRRILNGLAAGSVAIALVLLIGAGLLQQSLARVLSIDPGFDRERLLSMTISLPEAQYEWKRNTTFCHEVVERARALPGVISAGAIRGIPMEQTRFDIRVFVEGSATVPIDERPMSRIRVIGPGYFETMGIPLLRGRYFDQRDDIGEIGYAKTVLINETMANLLWPDEDALHKRFRVKDPSFSPSEVIGVVADVRYGSLETAPGPEMYYPDALFPQDTISLVVRTKTDPNQFAAMIQREVRGIQPDVIITDVRTIEQAVDDSVADRRFVAVLLTSFSVVAFVLVVVGNYGVVACSAADRKRELGIRLALGARPGGVLWTVVRGGLALSLSGIAVGLFLAWAGTRLLRAFLYEVQPTDVATYTAATLLLAVVSAVASFVPAWRASRVSPMKVLREE